MSTSETQLWWWEIPGAPQAADLAVLTDHERERTARHRAPHRAAEFATSRAAVRRILADRLDVRPDAVMIGQGPCPGCRAADHGPPTVLLPATDIRFSVSHTSGIGCMSLSQATAVGVDVEAVRRVDPTAVDKAFSAGERAYIRSAPPGRARDVATQRCWTRKEAVLKAEGIGVTCDLTAVDTLPGLDEALVDGPAPDPQHHGTARSWRVLSLWLGTRHLAAVARSPDSGPVAVRRVGRPVP
ncbi:4'-phosphopantetheinyl transferase family protein [Streptacidiphilus neutrinimicus]|uniref:4'-phosphopantetheinyl transferase family protein n=1 Tax=Streptacidiphilus neutrinimicus TaxID=105420 RepID=UPI0006936AB9|nr:4'-phosphopantetheinyl transferase superfamily protein [Streptacidiphilus neutrinimicus]